MNYGEHLQVLPHDDWRPAIRGLVAENWCPSGVNAAVQEDAYAARLEELLCGVGRDELKKFRELPGIWNTDSGAYARRIAKLGGP